MQLFPLFVLILSVASVDLKTSTDSVKLGSNIFQGEISVNGLGPQLAVFDTGSSIVWSTMQGNNCGNKETELRYGSEKVAVVTCPDNTVTIGPKSYSGITVGTYVEGSASKTMEDTTLSQLAGLAFPGLGMGLTEKPLGSFIGEYSFVLSVAEGGTFTLGGYNPNDCPKQGCDFVGFNVPSDTVTSAGEPVWTYWNIGVKGITVDGKEIQMDPTQAIIDSGTSTLVFNSQDVFDQILESTGLSAKCNVNDITDMSCPFPHREADNQLNEIILMLSDGDEEGEFRIAPSEYMTPSGLGSCTPFLQLETNSGQQIILGDPFFYGHSPMYFDYNNKYMAFNQKSAKGEQAVKGDCPTGDDWLGGGNYCINDNVVDCPDTGGVGFVQNCPRGCSQEGELPPNCELLADFKGSNSSLYIGLIVGGAALSLFIFAGLFICCRKGKKNDYELPAEQQKASV